MSDFEPSDDFADAVAREHAEADCNQLALLDPRGITSQKPYDQIEAERWEATQQLAKHLDTGGLHELAKTFRECHSHQTTMVCDGCHKVSRFWNRCDVFFCPQCSPSLSSKRLKGLMFFVEAMSRTKHIVLTFKNVPHLTSEYLSWCKKKLAAFRRRKIFGGAVSGLWAMEITNEGNGWHVHFHLVVDVGWIDVRELSRIWADTCGDGSKIVWIEDATRGGLKANLPRYIAKYASKGFRPQDWTATQFCEFVLAVRDGRTFGVFGALLGKRAEWREWLAEFVLSKKTCECGCCTKRFYSQAEWEWLELQKEVHAGRGQRPPPIEIPQMDLI
jgi:hypothetical protein